MHFVNFNSIFFGKHLAWLVASVIEWGTYVKSDSVCGLAENTSVTILELCIVDVFV